MKISDDDFGHWAGRRDYDICNRPDVCGSCLQRKHLKAECRRRVIARLADKDQGMLF